MSALILTRKRFLQLGALSFGAAAIGSINCGGGDSPGGAGGTTAAGAGTNGAAGTTAAAAGTNGAAGTNATAGTNGAAGTNAAAGTNGAAGGNAAAGTNGAAGTNAAAGTNGAAGGNAAAGTNGAAGTGGANSCTSMVTAKISMNHGHAWVIPTADIMAGVSKCYTTKGTASHDHWVTVTPAEFAMLKAGMTVLKRSCNGGDHQYVLSCAATSPAAADPGCTAASTEGMTMC